MRTQDGSRGRDGPTDEDLHELRDVIIHCDGSVEVLGGLSEDIARDVPVLCEQAKDFVLECVTELPVKTPVYAALVGLVNSKEGEFGERVVEATREALVESLNGEDVGQRTRARLLTRFLLMLSTVGVVSRKDALEYLSSLISSAKDLAEGGSVGWQPRADWLAYVALSALPWGGETLSKSEVSNEMEALLDMATEYCSARTTHPDAASTIIKSADGHEIDWFVDLCNRLNAARTDGNWHILSIPTIAEPFVETLSSAANAHGFAAIKLEQKKYANHTEAVAQYPGRSMLRYANASHSTVKLSPLTTAMKTHFFISR